MTLSLPTDAELLQRIIGGCRRKRIELGLTQAELSRRAGISRRTVQGFEDGRSINLLSLIKVLRVLGELPRLEQLAPEVLPSPKAAYLRQATGRPERQRVRRGKA